MRTIRIGALAALILTAAALGGVLAPGAARGTDAASGGITVNGQGSVIAVPDRASFDFGVTTQAATAAAALQANGAGMQKVVAALKAAGIAAADLQTTQVSLQPQLSKDGTSVTGYTASSSVSALVRDLGKAGDVVDAAVGAGADSVGGPSLSVGDTDALYRKALQQAVADARTKAQTLADAAGLTLGKATSITEGSSGPIRAEPAAKPGSTTQIEPGTQEIQATVTVTYAAS